MLLINALARVSSPFLIIYAQTSLKYFAVIPTRGMKILRLVHGSIL